MPSAPAAPDAWARAERAALCDLLARVGPDAPTLCEGWNARDLAAHLVVREGRNPLLSAGIALPALSGLTGRAQARQAALPWSTLVEAVRTGPPKGSMMRSPRLDGLLNTIEYFVHHEDVRRAQPGWAPRALSPELADDLWDRTERFAKRITRKSQVGVKARRPDGTAITLLDRPTPVTIVGEPAEVLIWLFRRDHAQVRLEGEPAAVALLRTALREGSV